MAMATDGAGQHLLVLDVEKGMDGCVDTIPEG